MDVLLAWNAETHTALSETGATEYFGNVRRRANARSSARASGHVSASRQPNVGERRYQTLRAGQTTEVHAPSGPTLAVVKTTPVSGLGNQLAALRAAQDKYHAPKWWSRFAAHPVKSGLAAVLLLFLITIGAIAGPIAWRSYSAYKQIFNTPIPQVQSALDVQVNDEGTPYLVGINETQVAEVADWDGTSRITILLMGVDRREDEPSRSDTMILVNIDPVAKTARMISIPRDLRVFVPGKGVYKINAAYALGDYDKSVAGGGPGLTMRTIEANFGIDINYYAEIDFDGFTKIVDTVGGVTIDVPYPIKDNEYPGPGNQYMRIYFPAGWQHMDGEQVLQYARTRHDDSDLYRSKRQQQILLALRQQAVSLDLIEKAPQLIQDFGDAIGTDLSPTQAVKLARLASEMGPDQIQQLSLDSAIWAVEDTEYYFQADWEAVGDIMSDLTGEEIVPPNATIDDPNFDVQVSILDGSLIYGLGPRVLESVNGLGFANATTADLPDAGNYPTTEIYVSQENLPTGVYLARSLGLPDTAVKITDNPTTPTPADTSGVVKVEETPVPEGTVQVSSMFPTSTAGADDDADKGDAGVIIIRMGDDMPDPAWYSPVP